MLADIITISLFCIGLRIVSSPDKLLYFLRFTLYEKSKGLTNLLFTPVIGCATCMASFHSAWLLAWLYQSQIGAWIQSITLTTFAYHMILLTHAVVYWSITAMCVAALNALLYSLFNAVSTYITTHTPKDKGIPAPCQDINC